MPWTNEVDFDPFAAPAPGARPKVSLTVGRNAPPPETIPDAPREAAEPKLAPWAKEVDHIPDFSDTNADTQEPEAPKEQPGFLETVKRSGEAFDADLHRQRSAAFQGTTPNLEAHEKNLLSDNVVEGDDGNYHYIDAEGKLHPTDASKQIAHKGKDGKIRLYNRTEDTNEGILSQLGRLMQTGMATETPRFGLEAPKAGIRALGIGQRTLSPVVHPDWMPSKTATTLPTNLIHPGWFPEKLSQTATEAAGRLGIDLPRAIASESGNVHYVGQLLKGMPGGAPLREAIEEGITGEKGLAGATKRAGEDAGGAADARAAGEGVTTGLEDVFKPESQKLVTQLYDKVAALVDPRKTAPLNELHSTVAEILAKRISGALKGNGKAVEMVEDALQRPGGMTYEGLKTLRSAVGEIMEDGQKGKLLPEGMRQNELENIYTALSKDLGNAAETTGGPAARVAWERANALAKARFDALEVLQKALGSKARSNEGVMDALHRMAGTGAGADLETLTQVKKALDGIPGHLPGAPGAWENVASTVISRLGKDNKGNFSPNNFVRDYAELSPGAKRLLFHGVGKGDVISALDDIATVSRKYLQAGKLANTSGSAGHVTGSIAVLEALSSLFHGDYKTPIAVLGGLVGGRVASRVLGNPGTVKSVARWTRAVDALAEAPTARAIAAYKIASRNLANTTASAAGDPSSAPHLMDQLQNPVRRPDENQNQQGK